MQKKVAVVIPIYKNKWEEKEKMALNQALSILSKYDIIAVSPKSLILDESIFFKVERFEELYFCSVKSYNRLMLSRDFYRCFYQYEYILIYQLDAFVFSDRLLYFCNLGYDYIGAPWLHGMFNYKDTEHAIWYVGNGGLSLRRVDSFIQIIDKINRLDYNRIENEDLFFSSLISEHFHVAPMEVALKFAFERQVKRCFKENNYELPFGCHAWERYNVKFWKPYIEEYGFDLTKMDLRYGNEDVLREKEYVHWENISNIFTDKDRKKCVQNKLKQLLSGKEVIIWGAGFYGVSMAKWFQDIGLTISCFYDNDFKLAGKKLKNILILYPEDKVLSDDSYVIIANYAYEYEIEQQLLKSGMVKKENCILFSQLSQL